MKTRLGHNTLKLVATLKTARAQAQFSVRLLRAGQCGKSVLCPYVREQFRALINIL